MALLQALAALVVVLAFAAAPVFAERVDASSDAVSPNLLTTSNRKLLWLKDDGKQWCWYYAGKSQTRWHSASGICSVTMLFATA